MRFPGGVGNEVGKGLMHHWPWWELEQGSLS